jgi:thioredoxin 1
MSIDPTNVSSFDKDVLNAKVPVLVDFWAPWCGPCRTQDPILQNLAADREDIRIVKVNVDDNQELAARFQVRGIPSLILFNGGELVATKVGVTSLGELQQWVDSNVTAAA